MAWLYARSDQSRFYLRFEDLDSDAVRDEHYRTQREDLAALGIEWDEPVVNQSDRRSLYRDALDHLTGLDLLYPCYCSRREIREAASAPNRPHTGHHYPGTCAGLNSAQRAERALVRPAALRIRGRGETRSITDELMGSIKVDLDDFVIQRNDGTPAYHLAVVVDDAAQDVEQVVRGDDLAESACRQLLLYELLGLVAPTSYVHVPLVLAPNGDRLAKRHGAVGLADRMARGESVSEVLTFLASSIGLTDPQRPINAGQLLGRFDPVALAASAPLSPTLLSEQYLAFEP